jgi:hypothetical protein
VAIVGRELSVGTQLAAAERGAVDEDAAAAAGEGEGSRGKRHVWESVEAHTKAAS